MSAKAKPRIRKTIRIGGKRVSQYFRTRALADEWYRKMTDERDLARAGVEREDRELLLLDYAKKYIARRAKAKGHNVWTNDEQRMRDYILPVFGQRPMISITAPEWKSLFTGIVTEKGKAKATSNQVRAIASKMYNEAIEEGLLKDNPVRRVKPYKLRSERIKKIKEHFWHDQRDLHDYLSATMEEEPGLFVYKHTECNTGLRRSQLIPLKWKDIKIVGETRVFQIERAYVATNNTIRQGSKGWEEGEDYVVGINDALWEVLTWWKERTPCPKPDDYIFCQTKKDENLGKHFFSWHLKKAHERVIKRVNRTRAEAAKEAGENHFTPLKRIKPHGIRHTYATLYLEASGGSLHNLQSMLGHKDPTTTQIYAHVIPKTMQAKANAMNVRVEIDETAKRLSPQCHQNEKREDQDAEDSKKAKAPKSARSKRKSGLKDGVTNGT